MTPREDLARQDAAWARWRAAFETTASWPPSEPTVGTVNLERAERELARVHGLELARAARRAVALRGRGAPARFVLAFRRRLARSIADADRSDVSVPAALRSVARDAPGCWPSDVELARAARTLDPGS